ncbi:hypothetical protein OE88DRAFT_1419546 [Heliocybe sulcata]|uniref:Uncharacterized protein n=1 Tax=Heliocybe sulcata TaxID=5364 RepID=A0A5C3N5L4_9AGAM|nr:hypothetical protein OE88DRAFT_1419546 [Heliocybe sulcata]
MDYPDILIFILLFSGTSVRLHLLERNASGAHETCKLIARGRARYPLSLLPRISICMHKSYDSSAVLIASIRGRISAGPRHSFEQHSYNTITMTSAYHR